MSKKDYIMLSKVLRAGLQDEEKDTHSYKAIASIAYSLTQTLKLENSRFDSERFLTACGLN